MKPQEFIETDIIQESFGPRERIAKQLRKARKIKANVFPAGKKGNCPDIYALQACKALMLLIYNPNPANAQEVKEATDKILAREDFLNDFAWILESEGRSQKVKAVFICMDRAYAKIEFEGQGQTGYGDPGRADRIENFTVLRTEVLMRLAHLMKTTPRD